MPNNNQTIEYKQLLDNGEPFYPMVGKSSYSEWIGYEEVGGSGVHPDDQWIGFVDVGGATDAPPYIVPVANGGTGRTDLADMVIDSGTSGSWTYRKWANGDLEFWLHNFQIGLTGMYAFGSGYYDVIRGIAYPTTVGTFVDVPFVLLTYRAMPNGGLIANTVPMNVTTSSFDFMIWNPTTYDTSGSGYVAHINAYVKGRWK